MGDNNSTAGMANPHRIESTDNARVQNNVLRHEYRILTDDEKADMKAIKDQGGVFLALLSALQERMRLPNEQGRCYAVAKTKMEEAVMWAVKGLTH